MEINVKQLSRIIFWCLIGLLCVGCKIRIEVPEGGHVETFSGVFVCGELQTCDIDVVDIFFRETYVAVPNEGMFFNGWEERDRGLFGGTAEPAAVDVEPFADNAALAALLESDEVFFLSPTFSSECTQDCINPTLTLQVGSQSFFDDSYRDSSFPYISNYTISASVSGIPQPTKYTLAKFNLVAEGSDFTLANVVAYDKTGQVEPRFKGVFEGAPVRAGRSRDFELISPLTGGAIVELVFAFEVLETGDVFQVSATFQSN